MQLHGVCLGMEALSVAVSRNHSILSDYDSENLPSPLFLTGKARFLCKLWLAKPWLCAPAGPCPTAAAKTCPRRSS